MSKKKAAVEAHGPTKAAKPENTPKKHALTPEMEARKWKPGESGNPGGRPKRDFASEIAQAIFQGHAPAIQKAMLKKLLKGDAKAFTALADRGFGKSHQQIDVNGQLQVTLSIDL